MQLQVLDLFDCGTGYSIVVKAFHCVGELFQVANALLYGCPRVVFVLLEEEVAEPDHERCKHLRRVHH